MELYLINHGESIKDTHANFSLGLPDHQIYLTEKGLEQVNETGIFLSDYLNKNDVDIENAVMWISPFLCARQSAKIINKHLGIDNVIEDYLLIDQRHGLFSNKSEGRRRMEYEMEFKHYDNYFQANGEFYVKLPQGDSPLDVAVRTSMFLNMLSKSKNNPVFIVSHDTTIKTIIMNTFHYLPSWFNNERKMKGGSIRLINDNGCECVYGGYVKRLSL
ncbi:MAG: histidine phosphatase family protein [Bacilli bacterium]|nr:histidine phosphatase family protein [Bacilli bacterium]